MQHMIRYDMRPRQRPQPVLSVSKLGTLDVAICAGLDRPVPTP